MHSTMEPSAAMTYVPATSSLLFPLKLIVIMSFAGKENLTAAKTFLKSNDAPPFATTV